MLRGTPGDAEAPPTADAPAPTGARGGRHAAPRRSWTRVASTIATAVLLLLTLVASIAGTMRTALDEHPMSIIDEHVHLDTVLRVHDGAFPTRGDEYLQATIDEWACGVGHSGALLPYACGDPRLTPEVLPSGAYTTGYIHYPTYFVAGEAFHRVVEAFLGPQDPLQTARAFSAFVLALGAVAGVVVAWLLGLRRTALVAASVLPLATSSMVILGTIVNPGSSMLLAGVLIAGAAIRWVRSGRGFWLVAVASGLASITAVTNSLPAGGVLLAMLVALVAPRLGWRLEGPWRPRWWQAGVLAAILVLPIVLWGRWIAATATIDNEALFGFAASTGPRQMARGAFEELMALHSPWIDVIPSAGGLLGLPEGTPGTLGMLRQASATLAPTFGVLVLGALFLVLLGVRLARRTRDLPGVGVRTLLPLETLAGATIAGIVVYPVLLRVSNALTFGFDYSIVARYSNAFLPMLALLAMLLVPGRAYRALLATLACVAAVGIVASAAAG